MFNKLFVIILLIIVVNSNQTTDAQNLFVSTNGSDTNSGTINSPLATIPAALSKIKAGDTVFVRGGVYKISSTISTPKSGSSTSKYYLFAYGGERPILDFSSMPVSSSNRGIILKKDYWYIKGLDIKGAGDNGMNISASNNIVEFCSFYENRDTGLQLGGGASNNKIINCDSYYNADPGNGNADGFAPKLDVGTGNYFYGCRSWQNSDDGWDGYMRPSDGVTTTLENCWCFNNGYLENGKASSGNGNGFKMGGSDNGTLRHNFILKKCIAFDNRVKGFDQNHNRGSMTLYNCTAFRNGINYSITESIADSSTLTLINCLSLDSYGSLGNFAIQKTNSWLSPFIVSNDDFVSIDTTGMRGPRKGDGSLPDIKFLHLAAGSDLIDTGTDVGLPYIGFAPDLGAFEYDDATGVKDYSTARHAVVSLEQNYPNPFNPTTVIGYRLSVFSKVTLKVYDLLGREVAILVDDYKQAGSYNVQFSTNNLSAGRQGYQLASGVYFYRLTAGGFVETKKLILMK